ncbi:hypothetical protein [Neoroseomonas soli]|uniref:Uncharacterized protein n=1 Tax=Neoroseomonas soli TaxID=1081025 RepID=A0A9X9X4L4_9PROT|nr:hypothetical protein [Neoroseomonas soli]MBR0674343.1 hypothetical protein [Neoroseomonas soli]
MPNPTDCAAMLRLDQLAKAPTEAGYSTSKATLATQAIRDGEPAFRKLGRFAVGHARGDARLTDQAVGAQGISRDFRPNCVPERHMPGEGFEPPTF